MPVLFGFGLITVVLTIALIFGVRVIARRFNIVDRPVVGGRKIHAKPVPLLGGIALYLAIVAVVGALLVARPELLTINMSIRQLSMVAFGGLIIVIGGTIDDRYNLKPRMQIIFPILGIMVALLGGVRLSHITNPLGGVLQLGAFGALLAFVWLLGMTYTVKLLDGLDGLATGIVGIGALMIFALSQFTRFYQPDVALLAFIVAVACAAFLLFNFHPASIFLGESGSLFLGYLLGVLAIIAGGKIATTLLVMGLPILDVAWVIIRRLFQGKSVIVGDAGHLHHRLLRGGFSHRGAVIFMYAVSVTFGILTLVLQSKQKLIALGLLAVFMVLLGYWLVARSRARV
ncbi:MAG: undecaprenyl/decaprenyl-phosphate alpha-N-acetylglucosaminyl 1-phosphate transferase [Candidatus Magasanikbacteria bacterium]|nr:undecaprenyl/decaprenyl-phosphate alpha-N-acetylglucosaminyl 1-phosphate transferase [Candidatus Magasanikbacteria bacterium]